MDKETGRQVTSAFITYKGYTYYFDADGYAHTGWMKQGKDYYFFNANGAMVKNQWVGQYYLQKSGKMAVSKWISKGVYVGQDGKRIPGYQKKTRAKFIRNKRDCDTATMMAPTPKNMAVHKGKLVLLLFHRLHGHQPEDRQLLCGQDRKDAG